MLTAAKEGQTVMQAQIIALGTAILAFQKAQKTRKQVQAENDALFSEYLKTGVKTLTELSAAIMKDGQSDPKWKKGPDGTPVGYQRAIKEFNSPGAAGYNSFRSWCAKWYDEMLTKKTPAEVKPLEAGAGEEGGLPGEQEMRMAAEKYDAITAFTTSELLHELDRRAQAGDAIALNINWTKIRALLDVIETPEEELKQAA